MSDGFTTASATFGVSASAPATHDTAAFAALTYTDSCEVINFGEYGPVVNITEFETVCDQTINQRPGSINYGQQNMQLAYVPGHAVEAILDTALSTKAKVAIKITHGDGSTVVYNDAYVTAFPTVMGGSGDITMRNLTLVYSAAFV